MLIHRKTVVLMLFSLIILSMTGTALFSEEASRIEGNIREDKITMSLEQATEIALENNLDIQIIKYDTYISRTDGDKSQGIYDTLIEADVQYSNDQSAQTSSIFGTKNLNNIYSIGLKKKLPTGTIISMDMKNTRTWTNSAFASINPSHDSSLGVTVRQSLARNFFGMKDRLGVKITLNDIESARFTSLEKVEEIVAKVQKAYWDLVLKSELAKIEEGMVEQARKLYDLYQEKIKDGLVESPELYASEANYKRRINDLLLAKDKVRSSSNVLLLLLNINEEKAIKPLDSFDLNHEDEEINKSLKKAFEQRQDYKQAKNDVESKNMGVTLKRNNIWPELNLTASLDRNGISQESFSKAVKKITHENNPNMFAGIEFKMYVERREARSELRSAELEKAKALAQLKLVEREIVVNVTDQVRNTNVLKEVAINEDNIASLESSKLKEEEKKFEWGRSDADTIIRYQEDVLTAKLREAQAKYSYYSSLIDLKQKEGSLIYKYWDREI